MSDPAPDVRNRQPQAIALPLFPFVAGVVAIGIVAGSVHRLPILPGSTQFSLWLAGALALVAAFHLFDRQRERGPRPPLSRAGIAFVSCRRRGPGAAPHGRRMLFLAWMAACGPHALLSRLLPRRIAGITILGAAVASTVLSLSYIRTNYIPMHWYGEYGVERIHMFRAIWEAGPEGTVFLRPSTRLSLGIDLPEDELFVSFVPVADPGELRRALAEDASRIRTVILPAHTEADRNENRLWIDAFSDIAPPSAWRTGPTDPSGKAMYLVVRLPREGLGSESVTPAPDGRGD